MIGKKEGKRKYGKAEKAKGNSSVRNHVTTKIQVITESFGSARKGYQGVLQNK